MPRVIQLSELIADARFGEKLSVREFVKPETYQVVSLYKSLIPPTMSSDDTILTCWNWIVNNIKYSYSDKFILRGGGGVNISTEEFWEMPQEVLTWGHVSGADCDGMSFLLVSLLRNKLPASDVYAVIGNLRTNVAIGGHAWVIVKRGGIDYILEATLKKILGNPWKKAVSLLDKYQAKVYFNDREIWVQGSDIKVLPQINCCLDRLSHLC